MLNLRRVIYYRSTLHNFHDFPNHIFYLRVSKMAGFVKDDLLIRCKQTVWSYIAFLSKATGLKILILKGDCIAVSNPLTGYLTKQEIVSLENGYHQGRASLGPGQVRKRKGHNHHIALYKCCQASSSSGLSQSFFSEDSLSKLVSNFSWTCLLFRKRTKSSTSSSNGSGTCAISFAINCFLFIVSPPRDNNTLPMNRAIFENRCRQSFGPISPVLIRTMQARASSVFLPFAFLLLPT